MSTAQTFFRTKYYEWELTTSMNILRPGEKAAVQSVFLLVLAFLAYTTLIYLPNQVISIMDGGAMAHVAGGAVSS